MTNMYHMNIYLAIHEFAEWISFVDDRGIRFGGFR